MCVQKQQKTRGCQWREGKTRSICRNVRYDVSKRSIRDIETFDIWFIDSFDNRCIEKFDIWYIDRFDNRCIETFDTIYRNVQYDVSIYHISDFSIRYPTLRCHNVLRLSTCWKLDTGGGKGWLLIDTTWSQPLSRRSLGVKSSCVLSFWAGKWKKKRKEDKQSKWNRRKRTNKQGNQQIERKRGEKDWLTLLTVITALVQKIVGREKAPPASWALKMESTKKTITNLKKTEKNNKIERKREGEGLIDTTDCDHGYCPEDPLGVKSSSESSFWAGQ